jgi:NADPH:quinone reductase-like Zn-dependent oxidoreductase
MSVLWVGGFRKPKHVVLDCDIAGRAQTVGRNVKQFQPGDEVFGATGFSGGGFAEYVCAPEANLALKPANVSFEDAARHTNRCNHRASGIARQRANPAEPDVLTTEHNNA